NYIRKTEEDMLSYYPLEITETSLDPTSIMAGLQSAGDMPDLSELDNKVYVNSFLTQIAQGLTVSNDIGQNDGEYIDYLYDMPEEWYYAITQDTGATLVDNLFTTVTTGVGEEAKVEYRSLSSLKQYFINVLEDQEEKYAQMAYLVDYLGSVVNTMPGTSNFDNTEDRDAFGEYVLSQYDILYGKFPENSNQAVLVVGTNNDMTDLLLAQLGYITEDDFLSLFELGGGEITGGYETDEIGDYLSFTFKELTEDKDFTLYYNDAVYQKNESYVMPGSGHAFNYVGERGDLGTNNGADGVEIEITAVLRLKDGLTYGCLSRGLNLTEQLVEEYVQVNKESQIVQWMNTPIDMNDLSTVAKGGYVTFGEGDSASTIYLSPSAHLNGSYYAQITDAQRQEIEEQNPDMGPLLDFLQELYISNSLGKEQAQRALGGDETPNSIALYPRDFETKESILAYLDEWNERAEADPDGGRTAVQYTDTVGLLMGMVQTILDAITYVLVAFTAISLVVSTVMIGVITYVSVVERTKEIGVLRAIGARRKDIKRVFNAETFIIGLCSGCFGVVVAYLCQIIVNAILTPLTGIAGLASLAWYAALIMVVISVGLTLISGLVPASAAAKRDPVVALRSE
ncbi:MAG TPA: ABC transporter permease, partial [Candidatus Borkfalkia faecigallinarum]|nr:ABC transporter permease [Candidatus Borkfalkia faecigallinarum]